MTTQSTNIFELASKKKLRIPTTRGDLAVEALWDLPLQASNGFDLDSLAQYLDKALEAGKGKSFVTKTDSPGSADMALRLDIVKHIIEVKLEAKKAAEARVAKAEKRTKLVAQLAKHQDAALEAMTPEQIEAELAKLED
jgi:hypothetical protein